MPWHGGERGSSGLGFFGRRVERAAGYTGAGFREQLRD